MSTGKSETSAPAEQKEVLAIEAPPTHGEDQPQDDDLVSLDVGEGNVVKLDKLGPLVVNSDGTLSRIANWQDMTTEEQARSFRLLSKRNKIRLTDGANKIGVASEDLVTAAK